MSVSNINSAVFLGNTNTTQATGSENQSLDKEERASLDDFLKKDALELIKNGIDKKVVNFWRLNCLLMEGILNKSFNEHSLLTNYFKYFIEESQSYVNKDNYLYDDNYENQSNIYGIIPNLLGKPNFGGSQNRDELERVLFFVLVASSHVTANPQSDPSGEILKYLLDVNNKIVHLICLQLQNNSKYSTDVFVVVPSNLGASYTRLSKTPIDVNNTTKVEVTCCKINGIYIAKIFSSHQGSIIPFSLNSEKNRFALFDLVQKKPCENKTVLFSIQTVPPIFVGYEEITRNFKELKTLSSSEYLKSQSIFRAFDSSLEKSTSALIKSNSLQSAFNKSIKSVKESVTAKIYFVSVINFHPDKSSSCGSGFSFTFFYHNSNKSISDLRVVSKIDPSQHLATIGDIAALENEFITHAQIMLPEWIKDMESNKRDSYQSQIVVSESKEEEFATKVLLLEEIIKEEKKKPGSFAELINWIAQESDLEVSQVELDQVKDIEGGIVDSDQGIEVSPLATATILLNQARSELETYDPTDFASETQISQIEPSLLYEDNLLKAKLENQSDNNNNNSTQAKDLKLEKKLEKEHKRNEFLRKQKEEEFRKQKLENVNSKEEVESETKPQISSRVQKQIDGVLQGVRQKAKKFNRMLLNLARKQQQELQGNSSSMNTKGSHMNIHLQKSDGTSGGFTVVNKHGKVKDKVINPRAQKGMLEKALFSTSKPKKK